MLARHDVVDLEKDGTGYAYSAAYVEKMDLVISVCTSVAHLAGALGQAGVDAARAQCRLALGHRRRDDAMVSGHATVATERAGRLGRT